MPAATPERDERSGWMLLRGGDWPPVATFSVVAISALAWLALTKGVAGHNSPVATSTFSTADILLARAAQSICGRPPTLAAPLLVHVQWLAGWAIMIVAMMLPTTIPFLRTVSWVAGRDRVRLVSLSALTFVLTWAFAGLVLVVSAVLLSLIPLPDRYAQPHIVAGMAALIAGAYQFTPLKKACLDACRSPRAMLLCYWNGERRERSAVEVGLRYAGVCIGCCWATMLLTLIVGTYALPLMVMVSAIMLGERLLPKVRPLIPIQAGLALMLALLLINGRVPVEAALTLN